MTEKMRRAGEIREAVTRNENLATTPREGYGTNEKQWTSYDSPLEGYGTNPERDRSFGTTFKIVLPPEAVNYPSAHRFREYIEGALQEGEPHARTAIEFGGPGSKLFQRFTKDFFTRTAGVCLKDIRKKKERREDDAHNHAVIEGDIANPFRFNTELVPEINKTLNSDKADLIFSRMRGPLQFIEKDPVLLERTIQNWYSMLRENGLIFAQFEHDAETRPSDLEKLVTEWADAVKRTFPQIEIDVATHSHNRVEGIIRLRKGPGSPDTLPSLVQIEKISE